MILGIYGVGGLGREVLELARVIDEDQVMKQGKNRWEDIVFIDDGNVPPVVSGVHVYSFNQATEQYKNNIEIAIGIGEPTTREKLFNKVQAEGIGSPTLIHPGVHIPTSTNVGQGVIIQYGCYISCNVTIEDRVLIQPQANIGHDDILKVGCIISGMSNLAGSVTIGEYTYVGLSAAVREGVSIGNYSILGMYSAAYKDIPNEMIAIGNPARPMKENIDKKVFG